MTPVSRRFARRADWVWRPRPLPLSRNPWARPDFARDANTFVCFRRTFDLTSAPEAPVVAYVSADARYKLWVNGSYVGRGPARCDPAFQCLDAHDLAPYLRAGVNVIAVLVRTYGRDMSWYQLPRSDWAALFGTGAFFFQCDLPDGTVLDSGPAWRCRASEAWRQDVPGGPTCLVEVFDGRGETVGWRDAGFDDTVWEAAQPLRVPDPEGGPDAVPFPDLYLRDVPHLLEEERLAEAVLQVGEVESGPRGDDLAEDLFGRLQREDIGPIARCLVEEPHALIAPAGPGAVVRTVPGRAVSFVVDFGRTLAAYPRLHVNGPAEATIDVAWAEHLVEGRCRIDRPNPVGSGNAHRLITRAGEQTWEAFDWCGYRYAQVTVRDALEPVALRLTANFTSYPVRARGSFACSDPVLERVWRAGAYTLQLCMHDGFEDCPSREQRQWVGDAYVQSLVNYAAFGEAALVRRLLLQVAQSPLPDGMTHMAVPGDAAASWRRYIPGYCLYWIMTIGEYVRYTGDESVINDVFPAVIRAVEWFERHLGPQGLLDDPPGWLFTDWAELDLRGEACAPNCLLVGALHTAVDLARMVGNGALAQRWMAVREQAIAALNARLWDEDRGVYVDSCVRGVQGRRVSQQSNAAAIAFGVAPRQRWGRILRAIFDETRLKLTSSGWSEPHRTDFDDEHDVVLAQPFFMHHVHRALAAAGRYEALVENVRRRWGAMLDAGATTLWEHWTGWASRCHAWSATPTFDLSTEVLGVRPLASGFSRFAVEPHLVGLTWAKGAFPTPHGDITVSWERADGKFRIEVTAPEGTAGELRLVREASAWGRLDVHSEPGRASPRLVSRSGRRVVEIGPGRTLIETRA